MASRLVVQNTSILDVENLNWKHKRTIVIESGHISWVGSDSEYKQLENDDIIDGQGKYTIPGMMDLHVHLDISHAWISQPYEVVFRHRETYRSYQALKHAQQYIRYGFTTLRGCGSEGDLASLQAAFDDGIFPGPRLKLATKTIVQPGDQQMYGPQDVIDLYKDKSWVKPGVDGVIAAVRDRKANGASHIKTTTTGGVLHGKDSKVELTLWRDEELEAMVSEAERLGMYVAAHAHTPKGIMAAVKSGVRTIEHSTILTDEIIEEMLKRGTYIVATQCAGTFIHIAPEEIKRNLPPEVITKWETVASQMIQSHKKAFEKGVPIACGTDAPVMDDHCHTPNELNLLVQNVGMTPLQAIKSATLVSAQAIRLDKELGSIEVGKFADLVLLNKDPSNEISVFSKFDNIEKVIKNGIVVSEFGKINHLY